MKRLTVKQVKAAAKKGPEAARACPEEHWRQGLALAMSPRGKELRKALTEKSWHFGPKLCALCHRYFFRAPYCKGSVYFLLKNRNCCLQRGSLYKKASRAIDGWEEKRKGGSILKVRSAMKAMIKALEEKNG